MEFPQQKEGDTQAAATTALLGPLYHQAIKPMVFVLALLLAMA
jgi:hypothetical protein